MTSSDATPHYHINPTGSSSLVAPKVMRPHGRKIIVDTYGGMGRHGGGAFSGKDPSKVDRSAAYMCRWVAKNIVAAGLADTLRTADRLRHRLPRAGLPDRRDLRHQHRRRSRDREGAVSEVFSFKAGRHRQPARPPCRPVSSNTASTTNYGHFGREDAGLPWEVTDKVDALKSAAS